MSRFEAMRIAPKPGMGALTLLFAGFLPAPGAPAASAFPSFTPRFFSDSTDFTMGFREAFSPADVDADGDLDILGKAFGWWHVWLENQGSGVSILPGTRPGISRRESGRPWLGAWLLPARSLGGRKGMIDALGRLHPAPMR